MIIIIESHQRNIEYVGNSAQYTHAYRSQLCLVFREKRAGTIKRGRGGDGMGIRRHCDVS